MKIKLAVLDNDQIYLQRLVSSLSMKYSDKFEIYSFTDEKIAVETIEKSRVDVFIASDVFKIDTKALPVNCGFAYLVNSADIEMLDEQRVISKFQKIDMIYKQILSIYSENAGAISGLKLGDDSTRVIFFSSPNGGTGTSSVAADCAVNYSKHGKKTMYLNLEKFGSSDAFFEAEGQFDMSDIIYALKSRKTNLSMKSESCVKQDKSGVYFFSKSKVALDMFEINDEDVTRLINELKLTGSYDYIIVDVDFSMNQETMKLYKEGSAVVWVGDGSELSNTKIQRAYEAIKIKEQNAEVPLFNRVCLIYNKFSSKTGKSVGDIGIRDIGGAQMFTHATTKQIIEQLSSNDMFNKII
ncbi:MAG: chromosome partitioning protein ParA [Clostridia bacterium]|nr:chromosome partitioning protein ParA [Clostridia bacterium]